MSAPKKLSQQGLLQILEDCKQIPKNDRLLLRKMLKNGDEDLSKILQDHYSKKLQIRLRKHLSSYKQNRKLEPRALTPQKKNYQKIISKSVDNRCSCTIEKNQRLVKNLSEMKKKLFIEKSLTQVDEQRQHALYENSTRTLANSKVRNTDLFTKPELLQECKEFLQSKGNKYSLSNIANPLHEQNPLSAMKSEKTSKQEIKEKLNTLYGQQIFERIICKYFPTNVNPFSVYLPFYKFMDEINKYYLQIRQEKLFTSSTTVPIMPPFNNEFQSVNIEEAGKFLWTHCQHKGGIVREVYILLQQIPQNYMISVEKFTTLYEWRNPQLVKLYKQIINKWAKGGKITYWSLYRIKSEEKVKRFIDLFLN